MMFFCLFAAISSMAQQTDINAVPQVMQDSFIRKFPGATEPVWSVADNSDYSVNFKTPETRSIKMTVAFAGDGRWLRTIVPIRNTDLPVKAQKIIRVDYEGYVLNNPEKIEWPDGRVTFKVLLLNKSAKAIVEFSKSGAIISK